MKPETAKNLGGAGALLLVISGLGIFGFARYTGLLGLAGIVLLFIALKGMADHYREPGIFSNAIYSVVTVVVGVIAFVGAIVASVFLLVTNLPAWAQTLIQAGDWQGLADAFQQHFQQNMMDFNALWALVGGLILALLVLFVFAVLTMFFFRRSLGLLAKRTNVGLFATSGLLLLIGALLTVVLIGFLLIWVGLVLLAAAFFSVRAEAEVRPSPMMVPPPPP
ncbi:MAG TPA: DUF996 domain-containing protein [Candidatus Bathyarchaeia archaeon]|nr:DUF996 domain-containing protein [Candidatus Bathyarchaeia archaeon]